MNTSPPMGQYSPDGRFWWDGASWQPVPPAPVVPAAPASVMPPAPVMPVAPAPRRPSTVGWVLALLGVIITGLIIGGITGIAAGGLQKEPEPPMALPTVPAEFPNGAHRYLPEVTVPAIAKDWLEKGNSWACQPDSGPPAPSSGAKYRMTCEPTDGSYVYVDIEYDDESQVRAVEASCHEDGEMCHTLYAGFGDALFVKRSELRKQAEKWAGGRVASGNVTVLGGIRLEARSNGIRATPLP